MYVFFFFWFERINLPLINVTFRMNNVQSFKNYKYYSQEISCFMKRARGCCTCLTCNNSSLSCVLYNSLIHLDTVCCNVVKFYRTENEHVNKIEGFVCWIQTALQSCGTQWSVSIVINKHHIYIMSMVETYVHVLHRPHLYRYAHCKSGDHQDYLLIL